MEIWTLLRILQSLLVRLGVACGVQSLDFREILVLLVRNAWFDSGYMFCVSLGAFGRLAHISYVKGNSDLEVDSRPALRRAASRFGEVSIVDASVAVFALWTVRSRALCI